jgi:hypothetical protein
MMNKQGMYCVGLICLLFLAVGCNGGNCSLKGKVVFSDDQSPVTAGTVCFLGKDGLARGNIDQKGNYVVGFTEERDGLPPGTYQVYLTGTELSELVPGSSFPKITNLIDFKYASAETSELTVEVKSSMTYNIKVDRFK